MAPLDGRRVLLVEDEGLVALMTADTLTDAGAVVETALSASEALKILAHEERPDAAVLDVNLGSGQTSEPVAEALRQRGIPFLIATGYASTGVPAAYGDAPLLAKPYRADALVAALACLCRQDR